MANKLIEKTIERDGQKVIQGRSKEGKLLIEKTGEGYELKCPRSKEVYVITYEEMLREYKEVWNKGDFKGN
jgi:phage FluMu protein Com